ncbi:FmdB family transcriptional regulator [Nocardioides islandensis]|uniref:FmdB family transcriptional regulator n=1 Tax=Nocardioides islandensis TaxID=433663 RepID=A0A930YEA4_9ACTN|nr:FmdB family zinc ribbon protein [Nocardioides islandensis]MBF4763587.1 FmdB family transcriptional regulator [Nocardioides islandensis]
MPTYQYACTECGHAFEQFQSFSDDALTECPECSGRLRKLFNAVGVVFKGSGFYRNDSRDASTSASASTSDTKSDTKTETKVGSKSETKTETTTSSSDTKAAAPA